MRIVVTGPESSGKTTLTQALSEVLDWTAVFEYARKYLEEKEEAYNYQDLAKIADGHFTQIQKAQGDLIVDTDFIVLKVWSEVRFGKTSDTIKNLVEMDLFDLHVVCLPDIPWDPDPLRENPKDRDVLLKYYINELEVSNKKWISVSGTHEERLTKSLHEIQNLLSSK
jgi:NadR type nicotinamide-nucleotide adenylyltransferase